MKLQSVQNTCRTNMMNKKGEPKHRSKAPNSMPLTPSSMLSSSFERMRSVPDELSEKRVSQRKERSRLAAQIRRNREGQSLMLIQNALPISSHVLGLSLIQMHSKSSNSINGAKQINQTSDNNYMIIPGIVERGQKKTAYSTTSTSNTMTGFLTTTTTAATVSTETTTGTSLSTIPNVPSAINLEKTRVLRIAGHTLFLLNKLSSYLRSQAQLCLSLNSQSVYGMLIDAKEMKIAYATPALAKAVGWSWIKLLGAPLHKLIKSTEKCQNSKEITKKVLFKSHCSLSTSSPSNVISSSTETPITSSSYPFHEISNRYTTSNSSNKECIDNIVDNEFILPEFITLLKLNSNEQQHLKNNKMDETMMINSSSMFDINRNTTDNHLFPDVNNQNITHKFNCGISKTDRIISSHHYSNNKMNTINKSIRKSSSSSLTTSKLTALNRFMPGKIITNTNNASIDNYNSNQLTVKSFHQNSNELVCYCWSHSIVNTFIDRSTGLNDILNSLDECNVNNSFVDYSDHIAAADDDDDKSLFNNELLDILMKDSFSPDSFTFDSLWDNFQSSPTVHNSCNDFSELKAPMSTGLYLCLLQPVSNKMSSFDDLINCVNSSTKHSNTISHNNNDNNINEDTNQNNLLNSSIHIIEDLQKSTGHDKQDSLVSFELHKNINIKHPDQSSVELSNVDTAMPTEISPHEQKHECIKTNSFQCHIYLNYSLTIKMVHGNYTDCFDIEDQNGVVNYSYLEFIHPDDLQNVITIFNKIIHTDSMAWISPYRISGHNKMVDNAIKKSYRWIRSLVSYNKSENIFVCSSQFLGLSELCVSAVGSNQRLLSVAFESSLTQFESKVNHTIINNSNIAPRNAVKTFKCTPSDEYSMNRRYHQQLKSKQLRISNTSLRPVRLKSLTTNKKYPTSFIIKNNNTYKPIKLFPFQSSQCIIKQQSKQGCDPIISTNNPIKPIRLLSVNNNKVPSSSYLNTDGYSNNKQINSVLNIIPSVKSSLHHSSSNLSSLPYYVKSTLPVVSCITNSPKKLIFLSSTSSLSSSASTITTTTPVIVNKSQSFKAFNVSTNKCRTDDVERGKYIEYPTIYQDNSTTSLDYNTSIHSPYSEINDLNNQPIFDQNDNCEASNPLKLTICNDPQWKSSDNCWSSSSLTDNSSPHSIYSSNGSSTSICLSPNEQNLLDFNVNHHQMEATVSELLETIPLPNKLSHETADDLNVVYDAYDSAAMLIDYNNDSDLLTSVYDFENNSEDFTGFQSDLMTDSNFLSSPV
ncbi:unnamed protein product [Schistosoma turkestanicum]|nr:unnamed protein product [Schistosoma turkestanicum]